MPLPQPDINEDDNCSRQEGNGDAQLAANSNARSCRFILFLLHLQLLDSTVSECICKFKNGLATGGLWSQHSVAGDLNVTVLFQ